MNIQNDILENINTRFVLLKKKDNEGYHIIDKLRRTLVMIDDPYIKVEAIIKRMLELNVTVFDSIDQLPLATELPATHQDAPEEFRIFIKKLHDMNGRETGSIVTALPHKQINRDEKLRMEKYIEHYAFSVLYPGEGLNLYSNTENDTASIVVIKGINSLPSVDTKLVNW